MSIYVPAYTPRSQGSLPPAARIKVRQTADTEYFQAGSSDCYALPDSRDYPDNLHEYKLVIHCGACTLNRKEMLNRIESSLEKGTPIINYGLCIAYLHGIFERALKPFPEVYYEWIDG